MMDDLRTIIASVKASHRLEEIVQRYGVGLKTASRTNRYEGLCPFHAERTPSFNVYLVTQRFICYGCGATGDVVDFVQRFCQCSLIEALDRLGGKVEPGGWQDGNAVARAANPVHSPVRRSTRALDVRGQFTDHVPILTLAQEVYHQAIFRFPFVLEYLAARGLSHMGVPLAGLGYSDGHSFRLRLRGKEELWQQARAAGLLTRGGREWLSGRLIIPEMIAGGCMWMIGRAVPQTPHWTIRSQDKYLGLALPKPVLGYGAALATLRDSSQKGRLQGILVQEGALDYVVAREWELPVLSTAIVGTHASAYQLHALLHLQDLSGLPLLFWADHDERGSAALVHFLDQVRGRPALTFPAIASVKDLAELAERGEDGYRRFVHAWHGVGEGGELW